MNYRTPGVYVEEVAKLPLSVAAVETAIPVFIGYTEIAQKLVPGDLAGQPTKICSLLEYEERFGVGPSLDVSAVNINENNIVSSSDMSRSNYLYDSIRLFYANGGGKCYIMSIGAYTDTNTASHYTDALTKLEKVDEPTLILFPDAVGLGSNIYTVQKAALKHCKKLQDRFCVFDLLESNAEGTLDWESGYAEFRSNIGVNDLNYGAVYTPHLISNLGISLNYRDIQNKVFRGGINVDLADLTLDVDTKTMLSDLDDTISDNDRIAAEVIGLHLTTDSIREEFLSFVDTHRTTNTPATLRDVFDYIYSLIDTIDSWLPGGANVPLDNPDMITDITNLILDSLLTTTQSLVAIDRGATAAMTAAFDRFTTFTFSNTNWDDTFNAASPPGPAADTSPYTGVDDTERRLSALPTLLDLFEQVYAGFNAMVVSSQNYENEGEQALFNAHAVYRAMITNLRDSTTVLPPSGAVVGIYAKTDTDRGVFKAPANASLNGVIGLTHAIDQLEQDELNVDPVSGKSINAIRAFTGKGILIWGARTLAGNDNEWRYVPVRRFFIFAEESIKKATEPFVFEPNDANTWTKIKAMISNFLTVQWRAGALAGAKPDKAFYVKIGLGETMTSLDILEGRMIVEIGMAVVRPAEFIILRFSHKMQES